MTKLKELFATIESIEFDAQLSIANGFQNFVAHVTYTPDFKLLLTYCKTAKGQDAVIQRLNVLGASPVDQESTSTLDTAIFCYLLALAQANPEQARGIAGSLAGTQNCIYTPILVRLLLSGTGYPVLS